jgi:hypothetical protein
MVSSNMYDYPSRWEDVKYERAENMMRMEIAFRLP